MVEVKDNNLIKVIKGRMKLDAQIQVNGVAIATESKQKKEVEVIKDKFGNLRIKK